MASLSLVVAVVGGIGCGSVFGSPEPSGLGSNGVRDTCSWADGTDRCLPDEYCDAPDCMSPGLCQKRPPPQDSGDLNWVCGCDGITYWNLTFAHAQGITAPTFGQCGGPSSGGGVQPTKPMACSIPGDPCPAGSVCLATATSSCTGTAQNKCWAWPNDYACNPSAQRGYLACGGTTTCMTECEAITKMARYKMTTIDCK